MENAAVSTLTLLQRFDKVTSARRRVLGETQRRIQRLGDVINRMGVSRFLGFCLPKKVKNCSVSQKTPAPSS